MNELKRPQVSKSSFASAIRLALCALVLTGCTNMCGVKRGDLTPEQVVEAYLDVAFNMKDVKERDLLLQYATGALKSAIEGASPEVIRKAYVDRKYELMNYSVVERRDRTPRETEITFQITYKDQADSQAKEAEAPKVTTENTVAVVREEGVWKIRDVMGNKTTIDFPVSEEAKITAKPGQISDPSLDNEPQIDGDTPEK